MYKSWYLPSLSIQVWIMTYCCSSDNHSLNWHLEVLTLLRISEVINDTLEGEGGGGSALGKLHTQKTILKMNAINVWKSSSEDLRSSSHRTLIKRHDIGLNYMTKYYISTQNPASFRKPSTHQTNNCSKPCFLHNYCVSPCHIWSTWFKPRFSNSKKEKIKDELQKS